MPRLHPGPVPEVAGVVAHHEVVEKVCVCISDVCSGNNNGVCVLGRRNATPSKSLMVFNLSYDTEPYTLQEIFEASNDVYLPRNRETGEKRGSVSYYY